MSAFNFKRRKGFVLVEFMILAAAVALLAMVAIAHFKITTMRRAPVQVAQDPGLHYALGVCAVDN